MVGKIKIKKSAKRKSLKKQMKSIGILEKLKRN
jgi:hypothetical protein